MNSNNRGWVTLINFVSFAAILGILTLHKNLPEQFNPWVRGGAIGMISIGFIVSGLCFWYSDRYSKVYDYEPTQFLGQSSTGMKARTTLMIVGGITFWTGLAGVILWFVVR
jgi:hypothetical protein